MKILSMDKETDPFKAGRVPEVFLSGFYDGENYHMCWDDKNATKGFLDLINFYMLNNGYKKAVCFCHNGGKFDFHYILAEEDFRPEKIMILNGRVASFSIYGDGYEIEFRDSFLIFPMALSAYAKDEIDYELFERSERDKPENKAVIIDYFKGDLKYLYDLVVAFIERFGDKLTIASAAMAQLQKNGYRLEKIKNENFDALFRDYYFGGRVECFDYGSFQGDYRYIDINSAYPFAMLSAHCCGKNYFKYDLFRRGKKNSRRDSEGDFSGSGEQRNDRNRTRKSRFSPDEIEFKETDFIRLTCSSLGAFPFRCDDGSLIFPADNKYRQFFCTGWELAEYIKLDDAAIMDGDVIRFDKTQNMREFVLKYYDEKKKADAEGDALGRLFSKLIMNSSYGKFALDCRKFKEHTLTKWNEFPARGENESEEEFSQWDWVKDFETSMLSLWERPAPTDGYFNVATAASITGYVRAMLFRTIKSSDSVLYCDTDSLICKNTSALLGKELGEWDIEANFNEVHIAGKKLYCAKGEEETKIASKGARLTYDEVVRVANGETIIWSNEAPSYSIKRGTNFVERTIKGKKYR